MSATESDDTKEHNKKRKVHSDKMFKHYWLEDSNFKSWLLPEDSSKYKARCKVCNVTMISGKSELQKHSKTNKHVKKMQLINKHQNIDVTFKNLQSSTHKESVKKAEIKLAALFAANNVAFRLIDQLGSVLKEVFPDSQICKDISIKRTKCVEIIKNVLSKKETNDLVKHLRNNTFSILLDESTDIGNYKSLAILARYLKNNKVETRLLELLQLDAKNLGASALYDIFKTCLEKHEVPLHNIIGVASDNASVMIGKHHSFFRLLQNDVSHVVILRCICHSAALVASNACSILPRGPEELIRNVYSYTSGSAKRLTELQEMQEYCHEKKHRMLKLATTRWLSRYQCVTRLLENWQVLESYFVRAVEEDKLKSSELILNELRNIYTKGYLLFLKYVLNIFNTFNTLFQSRKPLIHVLYFECMNLMKQLCRNYMDLAVVLEQNLLTLNVKNPRHFVSLENVYVGPECSDLLHKIPVDGKEIFLRNCLKFYIEAATDLQKRLPDEIFKDMSFLNPYIAFSQIEAERNINFNRLCDKFTNANIDKTDVIIEWRNLTTSFNEAEIKHLSALPLDEMWLEIGMKKRFDESLAFPNLTKLVNLILILPHSNAETERIFSIVTDTKTKKRNRITENSLNAVCVFRSVLQASELDTAKYAVTEEHTQLHNVNMYSFKNK